MNKPGSVTGRFTMRDEIESYRRELRWILDEIRATLAGLTAAQLNWRPDTGRANSACVIVTHVLASTRVYALGFGCGRAVERDRAAEFAATGSDAGPPSRLSTRLKRRSMMPSPRWSRRRWTGATVPPRSCGATENRAKSVGARHCSRTSDTRRFTSES